MWSNLLSLFRYFAEPKLAPIALAIMTCVGFLVAIPNGADKLVAYVVADNPGGELWHSSKEVLLYEKKSKYQVFAFGGSQFLQGFYYREEMNNLYFDSYGEQIDFLELGFSGQSIAESLLLLTKLPIDENTLVVLHVSPGRMNEKSADGQMNDNKVDECTTSRLSLLFNSEYSNLLHLPYGFDCDLQKINTSIGLLADILYGQIRATIKGKESKNTFNKYHTEERFFEAPLKHVRGVVQNQILKQELQHVEDNSTPELGIVGTKNLMPIETLYEITKNYVQSFGGRVILLEMPWNERFLDNNPAFDPENHKDAPVVYDWLVNNVKNGDAFSLSALTPHYYTKVDSLGIPFYSLRQPIFSGQDFYDSMHLTHFGRDKAMPLFFDLMNNEIERMKK